MKQTLNLTTAALVFLLSITCISVYLLLLLLELLILLYQ